MEPPNQSSKFLGVLTGVGRYILGLLILVSPIGISILKGKSINFIFLAAVTPPLNLVILPPMAIGLYFMLSSKSRLRLDTTLLLFYILFLFGMMGL